MIPFLIAFIADKSEMWGGQAEVPTTTSPVEVVKAALPYLGVAAISAGLAIVSYRHFCSSSASAGGAAAPEQHQLIPSGVASPAFPVDVTEADLMRDASQEEVLREQTDRTRLFYGDEAFAKIRDVRTQPANLFNHLILFHIYILI
jgi:hypothetical protein